MRLVQLYGFLGGDSAATRKVTELSQKMHDPGLT
tara:strand:- start:536 stop:637 length:102 start_codon:yes stop_codon:yes gene_type:complete